jgi:Uma2 family endonuclease
MQDNIIYMGVNAPKEHQRVIGKLMTALGLLYYRDQQIPYEPFPETMIDEGQTSPTPDILLFDHESKQNVVIIEVAGPTGAKRDFRKVQELADDYGVQEAFVYNYGFQTWQKYQPGRGEVTDRPSFCEAIGRDLAVLLAEV